MNLLNETKKLMPGKARQHWSVKTEGLEDIAGIKKSITGLEKNYREMRKLAREMKEFSDDLIDATKGTHSFDRWDAIEGTSKDVAHTARKIRDIAKKADSIRGGLKKSF
jgi:hypothetical protein